MPRKPPPPSGPASPETVEGHLKIGRRWIAEAMERHPGLAVEDAVVRVQRGAGPLAFSSVRRYRADLRYALREHFEREENIERFDAAWEKVDRALSARKARIPAHALRASARKETDATDQEARALFYELKRHAIAHGNPNAVLACLFVLVAGHAGFRPVELRGASLAGSLLTMPNAKKRPGHEPTRTLDIFGLHADVKKGIALLLSLVDHDLAKSEFAKWQKVIANQMMRACKRINIRVLSLYSFRHVAIASWSAAGLSPEEIARLCGHISIRTAHTHYARADKGHRRRAVARAADPAPQTGLEANPKAAEAPIQAVPPAGDRDASLEIDDMPEPRYRTKDGPAPMDPEEVGRWFDRLNDGRDPEQIAARLRAARQAREEEHAPRKPDGDEG